MPLIPGRQERIYSQLEYHSRRWVTARQAEDYSTMVESLNECDHWLDELLKVRPDLHHQVLVPGMTQPTEIRRSYRG